MPRSARALPPLLLALAALAGPAAAQSSLRFHGNGTGDVDRVKIRIDDPATALPGPPADLGAADFTIEFFLRGTAAENGAPAVACGAGIDWIYGNIVFDRDRYNQDRKFGLSVAGGVVAFGVSGDGTGDFTICGATDVLDGAWHHVAAQRRRSDGRLSLYVDGLLDAEADGPLGDVSYPDDGVPGDFCGGPCVGSDPFIVLGAEKHDAGPAYPSFSGHLDELRLSSSLRYAGPFAPPAVPFTPDAATAALYHFDEGSGNAVGDSSGAAGGPSDGERRFGGSPAGPEWSSETPFPADPHACRRGNVNAAAGPVADVLFVNGSVGLGDERSLVVAASAPFEIRVDRPPSKPAGTSRFALYAWLGTPSPATERDLPFSLGRSCFPMPLSGGPPRPRRTWNNIGKNAFLGAPTDPSSPAPSVVLSLPGLPAAGGATFFLQGLVIDSAAPNGQAAVTNGIAVTAN